MNPVQRIKDRLHNRAVAYIRRWSDYPEAQEPTPDRVSFSPYHGNQLPRIMDYGGAPSETTIGPYSSVGHTTTFMTNGLHHPQFVSTYPLRFFDDLPGGENDPPGTYGPIVVGADVWMGFDSLVMSGVTIGHGAVIAARAVVGKDVEPFAIVGGNPARMFGWRFEEDLRMGLLRIAWWDWPHEKVLAHVEQICSEDVAGFVRRHDPDGSTEVCPDC